MKVNMCKNAKLLYLHVFVYAIFSLVGGVPKPRPQSGGSSLAQARPIDLGPRPWSQAPKYENCVRYDAMNMKMM